MYVELITRVTVEELDPEEGILREALSSLYSLFGTTRGILRQHGPAVATPRGDADLSFGAIAVRILNHLLRPSSPSGMRSCPTTSRAAPRASPGPSTSGAGSRRNAQLRSDLAAVRKTLTEYADLLATVAGVPPIHDGGEARP